MGGTILDGDAVLTSNSGAHKLQVTQVADYGKWTWVRKSVLLLCSLAIVVDGLDNQVLGLAVPAISRGWHIPAAHFAPVVALGMVGMILGTTIGGLIGDRLGRKPALVASLLIFGLATGLTASAQGVAAVGLWRLIAGCGLGGAIPASSSLIAEFTPVYRRAFAVTIGITSIPVGAFIGGGAASALLPQLGWRPLFVFGAAIALALSALLAFTLPESPTLLLRRRVTGSRLQRSLRALGGERLAAASAFLAEQPHGHSPSVSALLGKTLRRDTLALWAAYFVTLFAMYSIMNWLPSLLTREGFNDALSSRSIALYNVGGVLGALALSALVTIFGSRSGLLATTIGGLVVAMTMAFATISRSQPTLVMAVISVLGCLVIGLQTALYSLTAHVYPTTIRATGIGAALGVGRLGALLSAYGGAGAAASGHKAFFFMIGVALGLAFLAIVAVQDHIPVLRRRDTGPPTSPSNDRSVSVPKAGVAPPPSSGHTLEHNGESSK